MIVVGSDLSRGSEAALCLAAAWARERASPTRVVHALEGPAAELPQADRDRTFAKLAEEARRAGLDGRAELVKGDALAVLAPAPDRVVVVGAEGGSATLLRRAGHVPAALAAALPEGASVLVAPLAWTAPGAKRHRHDSRRREPGPAFERLLVACALDGRDAVLVEKACAVAATSPGAEIHLVHVIDVAAARHHPPSARAAIREIAAPAVHAAQERLRDLAADAIPLELAARRDTRVHVVQQGPVERDLAGLASSQSIDLLVAGAGPTTSRLVGFATCAVLVLG